MLSTRYIDKSYRTHGQMATFSSLYDHGVDRPHSKTYLEGPSSGVHIKHNIIAKRH